MEEQTQFTITTNDAMTAKQLVKASDMAAFIWELKHNLWRQFKHTDYDYEKAWGAIADSMEEHNIDIDDLTC
jgi:hypothetical protein